MHDEERTPVSEIHILPDGRVYLFGAGSELLDVVAAINHRDELLQRRREACHAVVAGSPALATPSTEDLQKSISTAVGADGETFQ